MNQEFYEALMETFTPAEILDKLDVCDEDFLFYFKEYIEENLKEFKDDFPEYFYEGEKVEGF